VSVVVPVGAVPKNKAGIKAAHALGFARKHPFLIYITEAKLHDVNILDVLVPEPGPFT